MRRSRGRGRSRSRSSSSSSSSSRRSQEQKHHHHPPPPPPPPPPPTTTTTPSNQTRRQADGLLSTFRKFHKSAISMMSYKMDAALDAAYGTQEVWRPGWREVDRWNAQVMAIAWTLPSHKGCLMLLLSIRRYWRSGASVLSFPRFRCLGIGAWNRMAT